MRTLAILATLALAACQQPATFALVGQTEAGDEYVLDHGMSASDCDSAYRRIMAQGDYPQYVIIYCDPE